MLHTTYFLKFLDRGPLADFLVTLYRNGSVAKNDPIVTAMTIEAKYKLVRLASMGVIKFEKGRIFPKMELGEIAA